MVLEADDVIQGIGNIIDRAEKKDWNHAVSVPESFVSDFDRWSKRPVMAWVRRQYEIHRAT